MISVIMSNLELNQMFLNETIVTHVDHKTSRETIT